MTTNRLQINFGTDFFAMARTAGIRSDRQHSWLFWVLDVTNSTAIMGIILACFTLPRVLFGPFAGVFADRANKRLLIVFSDLLRGILFVGMGVLILSDKFPFGLIYPFALLISFFGAFFTPAINAAVPDIVHKDNLSRANSARGISQTASSLVGNSFGGVLYAILEGPVFFVINGICFIYSAITRSSSGYLIRNEPLNPGISVRK